MMTDDWINELEQADFTVRGAKVLYDHAKRAREDLIREIAGAGGTYREIAAVSGVSYQRVAQLVTGEALPTRPDDDELEHECPKCGAKPGEPCEGKWAQSVHIERAWEAIDAFRRAHPELG